MPTLHMANLFQNSNLFIGINTAFFDASTLMFLLVHIMFSYLHVPLFVIFTMYLVIMLVLLVTSIVMWPDKPYPKMQDIKPKQQEGADEAELHKALISKKKHDESADSNETTQATTNDADTIAANANLADEHAPTATTINNNEDEQKQAALEHAT